MVRALALQQCGPGSISALALKGRLDFRRSLVSGLPSPREEKSPGEKRGLISRTAGGKSSLRQRWIAFVGSLLCYERFFPGYSGFPLSLNTNI